MRASLKMPAENIARHIRVTGVVQGVGFRPFVWRLARELGLSGWIRNDSQGIEIVVEGNTEQLLALTSRVRSDAPPLARVDTVEVHPAVWQGHGSFIIMDSQAGPGPINTAISPDTAPCVSCLAELCDPANRRWRHAFINCTHCGPHYTVTHHLPYDRAQTSMAEFAMCADCGGEYLDPADRRFHAETNCCHRCGPRLSLLDAAGQAFVGADPVVDTLARLRRGEIVALKGVGGFQLVCDARNVAAVAALRLRKGREEKPFAILLANTASSKAFVHLDEGESALLESAERPIVLARKQMACDTLLPGGAPGLGWLGVMLPASPLHYLLFHEAAGCPVGTSWLAETQSLALVCTSANPGGEPLLTDNAQAIADLAGIADAFLLHDRDIVARCDDSVLHATTDGLQFVRRARGYTPRAIRLSRCGPDVLSLGGWFKNTLCITRGDEAFVSPHIGDLDNAATCAALEKTMEHMLDILDVRPKIVAHDLHPDFFSSRLAAEFAASRGLPTLAVQHHHAHIAAVLAEHGIDEPAIGLALDGVGLGNDGGAWGGELLRVDAAQFTRLGHLRPLLLPGGDRAAREPWRMAAAALHEIGRDEEIPRRFSAQPAATTLMQMLVRGIQSPPTSSMGRAFDAAAGLLGVSAFASYEGQAAMLLEGLAARNGEVLPAADGYDIHGTGSDGMLDLRPLFRRLADCNDATEGAALFHATLAAALADWAEAAATTQGLTTIVCGGGCFLNRTLSRKLAELLKHRGLRILMARQLPPNDGGLCLGQAWIAQRSLEN